MSVLGATNYTECIYFDDEFRSSPTRFIQIAMFEKKAISWTEKDVAYIFLTGGEKGSWARNWNDNGHKKFGSDETIPSMGLKSLCSQMNLPFPIVPVKIKNGDNESEIWKNFRIIFDNLQPDDEVFFDVTHGFRSIPMLVLVLNNYSKFLKNIRIKSITYGNYEARNEKNEAPIISLNFISELQDWTSAANMFIETGRTSKLSQLLKPEGIISLDNFAQEIFECRGISINKGESATDLKNELNALEKNHSFKEITQKIAEKVEPFTTNNLLNGFKAVEFCIQHHLIQQGVTLLLEFIVSFVIKEIGYQNITDEVVRNAVSAALNRNKIDGYVAPLALNEEDKKKSNEVVAKVFDLPYKKKLTDCVFKSLSQGSRNDLNHAGMRNTPHPTGYFEERLIKYHQLTREILNL